MISRRQYLYHSHLNAVVLALALGLGSVAGWYAHQPPAGPAARIAEPSWAADMEPLPEPGTMGSKPVTGEEK